MSCGNIDKHWLHFWEFFTFLLIGPLVLRQFLSCQSTVVVLLLRLSCATHSSSVVRLLSRLSPNLLPANARVKVASLYGGEIAAYWRAFVATKCLTPSYLSSDTSQHFRVSQSNSVTRGLTCLTNTQSLLY